MRAGGTRARYEEPALMVATITAVALFLAIWAIAVEITSASDEVDAFDAPSRLPNPGPRDLHAVALGTLSSAPVPRWT